MGQTKVTVYIPCHNYGHFLKQAIESVLNQTLEDWELIVINDGSTDDTANILKFYECHPNIRIVEQNKKGLNTSNNVALRLSTAPYIMRLDADDYLDEHALLVMSRVLDQRPDVGLVYPDYFLVNEEGGILELVRRKKLFEEVAVLDLPAHGACTMIRKEALNSLQGYSEEFSCQDGYELWLRFIRTFKPHNVNVPLFYYRMHGNNLTKNEQKIIETKHKIERKFVETFEQNETTKILAIVPILKSAPYMAGSAFSPLGDKPLLWHTLIEASSTALLDRIVITTNDENIHPYVAKHYPKVTVMKRPSHLVSSGVPLKAIVDHVLCGLKNADRYEPQAVMILNVNTPFRKRLHIERAIDTMTIFKMDTVIAVTEELAHCYVHDRKGLTPLKKNRDLRLEKEAIYKEVGAILLSRLSAQLNDHFFGERVGHVMMLPQEGIKVKSSFDLWMAEQMLKFPEEKNI